MVRLPLNVLLPFIVAVLANTTFPLYVWDEPEVLFRVPGP